MAMSKYKAFPPLMINLVEAGEVNGRLELAFERIADGMEKELKLTSKVKGAMVYPVILLTVCLIASILLTFIVLPIFTNLFEQMGVELPLLTSIFIKASKFAIGNWHFIIVVVMLAVLSGAFLLKNRATRKEIDRMLLELPYIGGVYNTILMARFTRTFSTLLEGGVEVLTSLEISKKVVGNLYMNKVFDEIILNVKSGSPVYVAISRFKIFIPLVVSMIRIGEESGRLAEILSRTAGYMEEDSDSQLQRRTALAEPLITIFLGVSVALIVISIVQPMFKMYTVIGK